MGRDRPRHAHQADRSQRRSALSLPPPIGLGDLARALHALEPADAERSAVAALLGLSLVPAAAQAAPDDERPPSAEPSAQPRATERADDESERPAPREPHVVPPAARTPRPAVLRELEPAPAGPAGAAQPLPAPAAGESPAPAALLVPRWTPGILGAMVTTTAAGEGPIDLDATIQRLVRGEPLGEIPRLPQPTLSRGAQVLVDVGEPMLPFVHDASELARAALRHIGSDRTEVLRFAGTPLRGAGRGPRRSWAAYATPSRPKPILLLSDLGSGRPRDPRDDASPAEWLEFAAVAEHAGCPVVALVPYPPERVDARIRVRIRVVVWDRRTSAAAARRSVRGPLEVSA